MRIVMIIIYLSLILFGVSFSALNATSVSINFYFVTYSLPISMVMALMFGLGTFFGVLLYVFKYWRLKSKYRRIRSQIKSTKLN